VFFNFLKNKKIDFINVFYYFKINIKSMWYSYGN